MSARIWALTAIALSLAAWTARAAGVSPALVTVEFENRAAREIWRSSGGITCRMIGGTAIGRIEATEIPLLQRRGLKIRAIGTEKAGADLYLVPRKALDAAGSRAAVLWEKYGQSLIEVAQGEMIDGRLLASGAVKMPLTPLPEPVTGSFDASLNMGPTIQWDPDIQQLVDQVDIDSMMGNVRRMEAFRTRMCLSDSSAACSDWLLQKFQEMGVAASFDSVYVLNSQWGAWPGSGWERSVVATTPGSLVPDREIIICGHFDSFRYPDTQYVWTYAPGADDNATGVAVAMEAARVFRGHSWEPKVTYAAWTGEEIGFWGSGNYAQHSAQEQRAITAVINLDMVGYIPDTAYSCNAGRVDDRSLFLSGLVAQVTQLYVPGLPITQPVTGAGSDHYPFAYVGYPAIELAERETAYGNPHWHQASDTAGIIDQAYLARVAKAAIAVMAVLGRHPGVVDSIAATDAGDGQSVLLSWAASPYSDVAGYWLHWELSSGAGSDSTYLTGRTTVSRLLSGLMSDSTYLFGVTAIDGDGHAGIAASQIAFTPRAVPLAPQGIAAAPVTGGINICWRKNTELDIQGYRLYRAVNDTLAYDSLNTAPMSDTSYADLPLSGADRYYYKVRALDSDGNCSPLSGRAYSRPLTMDQGILVVDETFNAVSGAMPRDSNQDQFYDYILSDYQHQQHEFGVALERPLLCDLAPYSTVLWHGDDYSSLLASGSAADLRQYLDWGGNLWFVGWKPTSDIQNNTNYPRAFADTSFVKTHLKLASVSLSAAADSFRSALGALGYPGLPVDPSKVPLTTWGGTMRYIESYAPADSGEVIYTIDMKNSGSLYQGLPCGVRHLGPAHKTAVFGFPLYFMDKDQAKAAAVKMMTDFGEPSGVAAGPDRAAPDAAPRLEQNGPNPFRSRTTIRYHLPRAGQVSLRIYNLAGQRVRTLVCERQAAGLHQVPWDGRGDNGRKLPSGIYFCGLEARGSSVKRKMVMVQ